MTGPEIFRSVVEALVIGGAGGLVIWFVTRFARRQARRRKEQRSEYTKR